MSWVDSYEIYEALNALERGADRYIDGKQFRLVAGGVPEDKLFQVVNRCTGLKDHFTLLEAVDFALKGELYSDPGFGDHRRPFDCQQCDATVKVRSWRDTVRCSPCGLLLCAVCRLEHQEQHELDLEYRRQPSERALAEEAAEFDAVCDVVRNLVPAAWLMTRGQRP